jgi:hypothetical protein
MLMWGDINLVYANIVTKPFSLICSGLGNMATALDKYSPLSYTYSTFIRLQLKHCEQTNRWKTVVLKVLKFQLSSLSPSPSALFTKYNIKLA